MLKIRHFIKRGLFLFQRITWDSQSRDREMCQVKGRSEVSSIRIKIVINKCSVRLDAQTNKQTNTPMTWGWQGGRTSSESHTSYVYFRSWKQKKRWKVKLFFWLSFSKDSWFLISKLQLLNNNSFDFCRPEEVYFPFQNTGLGICRNFN